MTTMPLIVCAVDDSDRALAVAEAGAWLARELAAELVLTHVFDAMAIPAPTTKELRLAGTPPEHIADVERSGRAKRSPPRPGRSQASTTRCSSSRGGSSRNCSASLASITHVC